LAGPTDITTSCNQAFDPATPTSSLATLNGDDPVASSPAMEILTIDSQAVTAIKTDGSFLIAEDGISSELTPGSSVIVDGQAISVLSGDSALLLDGFRTISLSTAATASLQAGSAVWTTNGHTFTASQHSGSVVVQEQGRAKTLAQGAAATIAGQVLSIPASRSGVLVDGTSTLSLGTNYRAPSSLVSVIRLGGQTITASALGSSMVLVDGSSTLRLADGSAGVIDGYTVTAPTTGNLVVVEGAEQTATVAPSSVTGGTSPAQVSQPSKGTYCPAAIWAGHG
jgi:hypothetical protein